MRLRCFRRPFITTLICVLTVCSGNANAGVLQAGLVITGASYARGWTPDELCGLEVANVGIGGAETTKMLSRLKEDVLEREPRVVVIWGFINDFFRGERSRIGEIRSRALDNLVTMVERVRSAGAIPVLVTEVTIRRPDGFMEWAQHWVGSLLGKTSYQQYINAQVEKVNSQLTAYAERTGVKVWDFKTVLADDEGVRQPRFAKPDGSHLTEAAYAALTVYARNACPQWQ